MEVEAKKQFTVKSGAVYLENYDPLRGPNWVSFRKEVKDLNRVFIRVADGSFRRLFFLPPVDFGTMKKLIEVAEYAEVGRDREMLIRVLGNPSSFIENPKDFLNPSHG